MPAAVVAPTEKDSATAMEGLEQANQVPVGEMDQVRTMFENMMSRMNQQQNDIASLAGAVGQMNLQQTALQQRMTALTPQDRSVSKGRERVAREDEQDKGSKAKTRRRGDAEGDLDMGAEELESPVASPTSPQHSPTSPAGAAAPGTPLGPAARGVAGTAAPGTPLGPPAPGLVGAAAPGTPLGPAVPGAVGVVVPTPLGPAAPMLATGAGGATAPMLPALASVPVLPSSTEQSQETEAAFNTAIAHMKPIVESEDF